MRPVTVDEKLVGGLVVSGDGVSSSLLPPLGGGPLGGPLGGLPPLGGGGGLESSSDPVPGDGTSAGGFGASVGILIFVSTVVVTSTAAVVVDQSSQAEWVVVLLSGMG
jgi:hypothetical protein